MGTGRRCPVRSQVSAVTTGTEWDVHGDGSVLVQLSLTWDYEAGEPAHGPTYSCGGYPGSPDAMALSAVRLDSMDVAGRDMSPGPNVRQAYCERFEAEVDRDDELRKRLEQEALEAYWERQPCPGDDY